MSKQRKRPPGSTFTRGMEFGTAAYISTSHTVSYTRECLIHQLESLIVSQQPRTQCVSFNQSSYIIQHPSHSHQSIVYYLIVIKYTCLSNIRIHYSKPLSDGSKSQTRELSVLHGHHIHCAHTIWLTWSRYTICTVNQKCLDKIFEVIKSHPNSSL